jgi:hypothetical protein
MRGSSATDPAAGTDVFAALRPKIRPEPIWLANRRAEIHDNLNEKPDLYAAAICIKVRSDHLVAGLPLVCSVPAVCRTARRR